MRRPPRSPDPDLIMLPHRTRRVPRKFLSKKAQSPPGSLVPHRERTTERLVFIRCAVHDRIGVESDLVFADHRMVRGEEAAMSNRIELSITRRFPSAEACEFGAVGGYERLDGRVNFAV